MNDAIWIGGGISMCGFGLSLLDEWCSIPAGGTNLKKEEVTCSNGRDQKTVGPPR